MLAKKLHYYIKETGLGTAISLHQKWDDAFYNIIREKKVDEMRLLKRDLWTHDNSLSFLEPLKSVKLYALRIADDTIEDITPIHHLSTLKILVLDTRKATVIDLQFLPHLEEIYLLRKATAKNLGKSSLKRLHIYPTKEYDPSEFFRLEKLESLTLGSATIKDLTGMKNLRALKQLKLLNVEHLESLKGIEYLTNLEELRINNTKSIMDFELLREMKKLKILKLLNCGVIKSLEPLKNNPTLEEVYIAGDTAIADGNMRILKTISNIKSVGMRTFPHYNLEDEDFTKFENDDFSNTLYSNNTSTVYFINRSDPETIRIEEDYIFTANNLRICSKADIDHLSQGDLLSNRILEHILAHLNSKGLEAEKHIDSKNKLLFLHSNRFKIEKLIDIRKDRLLFKQALPELLKFLESAELANIKIQIMKAIEHRWLGPEAAPVLVSEFKKSLSSDRTLGLYLGSAMKYAVTPEVLDDLILLVQDQRYGWNRRHLIYALQKLAKENDKALDAIIESLKDAQLRIDALRALGKLRAKSAEAKIEPYILDEVSWVRLMAERALKKIREK
jgi:hypothetical protein